MTATTRQKRPRHLRARRRLTSFIYILLRDELTAGTVEDILKNHVSTKLSVYANRFLADYARSIADRLLVGAKKPKSRRGP